jgi:hypothetical protein
MRIHGRISSIAAPVVQDICDDRAKKQKNHAGQRRGLALDANVNAARDHEQRTDQHDETDVIMRRVQNPRRITQNQNVIAERDHAESERDFGVMPQPPIRREQRRERHRAKQERERQNNPWIWRNHFRQLARAVESGSNRNDAFNRKSEISFAVLCFLKKFPP